jgi:hypothetical protein
MYAFIYPSVDFMAMAVFIIHCPWQFYFASPSNGRGKQIKLSDYMLTS